MRIRRTERIPAYDFSVVLEAVPAVLEEWKTFRFEPHLRNAVTGEAMTGCELVSGRHRQAGAVYEVRGTTTAWDLPDPWPKGEELNAERRALEGRGASDDELETFEERRLAAIRDVRIARQEPYAHRILLVRDEFDTVTGRVGHEDDAWHTDVDIHATEWPRLGIEGQADLTVFAEREGVRPGCLARLMGGRAEGRGQVQTDRLELGGRLIEAKGRANRFRGRIEVDIWPRGDEWEVELDLRLTGKGIARILLIAFRKRLRTSVEKGLDGALDALRRGEREAIESQLRGLRKLVQADGGHRRLVRSFIWSKGHYDPPESLLDDPDVIGVTGPDGFGLTELDED